MLNTFLKQKIPGYQTPGVGVWERPTRGNRICLRLKNDHQLAHSRVEERGRRREGTVHAKAQRRGEAQGTPEESLVGRGAERQSMRQTMRSLRDRGWDSGRGGEKLFRGLSRGLLSAYLHF